MNSRFAAAGVLLALLMATGTARADTPTPPAYAPITIPLDVEQVPGKPIYYSVGNPGIPGKDNEGNTSNAGYVVTSDGVVVFDALGTPSHGWALLQDIRKITDKPVRYVIASHYHADHIYGLQAFKDHTGAIIIAQERAGEYKENEETADEKADQRLDQRRGALFPWVDDKTRVVPPDITFKERMTIVLGDRRLTLLFAGPAHSSSDMMMMVEPDGVLFAGDIVQNSRIPFMNSDDVSTTAGGIGGGREAAAEIHHSRSRQAVDRSGQGDRLHARLHSVCPRRDGQGGAELDRFRCRLHAD